MNITFLQVDCFIKVYCPNNHMCVVYIAHSKTLGALTWAWYDSSIPDHIGDLIKH